jgi:hypothetical protein
LIPSWYFSFHIPVSFTFCFRVLFPPWLDPNLHVLVGKEKRLGIKYSILLYTLWVLFKRWVINLKNKSIKLMATQEWYVLPIITKQSNVNKWMLPTHHQNGWSTKEKQTLSYVLKHSHLYVQQRFKLGRRLGIHGHGCFKVPWNLNSWTHMGAISSLWPWWFYSCETDVLFSP